MKKFFGSISCYPEYKTAQLIDKPSLVFLPDEKRKKIFIKNIKEFLKFFKKDIQVFNIPSEDDIGDLKAQIDRNLALLSLLKDKLAIYCLTQDALNLKVRSKGQFLRDLITVKIGEGIDRDIFLEKLQNIGYEREDILENIGEFSVKGSFVSVYLHYKGIVEIDFFGDTVENIFLRSKLGTRKRINSIDIIPLKDFSENGETTLLKDYLQNLKVIYVDVYNEPFGKGDIYFLSKGENPEISLKKSEKFYNLPITSDLYLKDISFLSTQKENVPLEVEPLREGDYVVHEDYGIGIFRGIETKQIKGKFYDFMVIEYAENEKIYLSYLHFDKIFKYKGSSSVVLDKIGGTSWRNLKKKVKSSLRNIARQLIKLYSEREKIRRKPLKIDDELIKQFEEDFPYVETPDQLKAINDVKKDLSSDKPMERVICGDVGFGKTEVAIRAVFINGINGKQSLVLAPTTILSYQHFKKFNERLKPYGFRVENLSRLKSKKETEKILRELKEGRIDVLIGTHKALRENVEFKNLGLLVIDEEHRFGVRAKEKIKQIKKDVDVLYMTATPIPRTLNMAISGLKKLSVINTPPEGRVETKTYVFTYSLDKVKEAIERELRRKGQIFYVFNRIEGIYKKKEEIQSLFPDKTVAVAHGKMKPKEIEKVLIDFMEGKIDILVSTSIIETGIDIPTANTLIVERADLFGLAQLYHLRGRVGRGNIQAYCYLFLPEDREITPEAEKRISVIKKLTKPGSGLKLSIEDMQIRGAGNILGVEQSGHIKAVGYEMYIKLLKEAINEEIGKRSKEPDIVVDLESYIPEEFIQNPTERLNVYMALSKAEDTKQIEEIKRYLEDFYDGLPEAFKTYIQVLKIKKFFTGKGFSRIELKRPVSKLFFDVENPPEPQFLKELLEKLNLKAVYQDRIEVFTGDITDLEI